MPQVFRIAILLELLERLAFYGAYVNLAVYLSTDVGLSDIESGWLLGTFAAGRSWLPVATGALADRIGFRRALLGSFVLYILSYGGLFALQSRAGAWGAVMGIAVAGSLLKPVIPATVRKYSPPGRENYAFSIFYASINAGSVVGKTAARFVRGAVSLRATFLNSLVASAVGLAVAAAAFREPSDGPVKGKAPGADSAGSAKAPAVGDPTDPKPQRPWRALLDPRLVIFLAVVSGYYLLIEQFYQTFPVYFVRQLGEGVPREIVTLVNPAAIALLQVPVGRAIERLPTLVAMPVGVLIGALSMFIMGAVPSLPGACASFFVFALAEMFFSPRYYAYVTSFSPKGAEGLTAGVSLIPAGLGGLAGGVLSGSLIQEYLPRSGPLRPLAVWGTYAALGVVCATALAAFGAWARGRAANARAPR
jgi:dipeptide/tripeptide permease